MITSTIQLPVRPQGSSIERNRLPVHIRTRPARQIHHDARDVLRLPEPPQRVLPRKLIRPARQLQQPVGHLAREEAGRDGVDRDVSRTELDGQVASQVQDGRLAGRVPVRSLLPQRPDAQTGHARGDEHTARVLRARGLAQQRREHPDRVEDGLDVQIHDLGERRIRVCVEGLAPGRPRVGEEDVHAVRVLPDLREERLDALDVGRVGGDGDRDGAGREVREGVEGLAGGLAGGGFAGGDEDLGGPGLEESGGTEEESVWGFWRQVSVQFRPTLRLRADRDLGSLPSQLQSSP